MHKPEGAIVSALGAAAPAPAASAAQLQMRLRSPVTRWRNGWVVVPRFVLLLLLWSPLAAPQHNQPRDCGARTCYDVLGVGQQASADDIKKAYRALAKRWHPDKNPDDKEEAQARFTEIGNANEILTTEREQYDELLRFGGARRQQFHPFHHGGRVQFHNFHSFRRQQQAFHNPSDGVFGASNLLPLVVLGYLAWSALGRHMAPTSSNAGASQKEEEPEEPAEKADVLPKGTRILVHGLSKRPELNGKRGGVQSYNGEQDRYIVQLDGRRHGEHTSLRAGNIQQIIYAKICEGEQAGERCRVVGVDAGTDGQWCHRVELGEETEDCTVLSLEPHAVRFPNSARTTIAGLKGRPELNGQRGMIGKWDGARLRCAAAWALPCLRATLSHIVRVVTKCTSNKAILWHCGRRIV